MKLHLEVGSRSFHSTRSLEQSTRALDPDPGHNFEPACITALAPACPRRPEIKNKEFIWKPKN
jgi:hypothetical protein